MKAQWVRISNLWIVKLHWGRLNITTKEFNYMHVVLNYIGNHPENWSTWWVCVTDLCMTFHRSIICSFGITSYLSGWNRITSCKRSSEQGLWDAWWNETLQALHRRMHQERISLEDANSQRDENSRELGLRFFKVMGHSIYQTFLHTTCLWVLYKKCPFATGCV